jgi:hypothetical protein
VNRPPRGRRPGAGPGGRLTGDATSPDVNECHLVGTVIGHPTPPTGARAIRLDVRTLVGGRESKVRVLIAGPPMEWVRLLQPGQRVEAAGPLTSAGHLSARVIRALTLPDGAPAPRPERRTERRRTWAPDAVPAMARELGDL